MSLWSTVFVSSKSNSLPVSEICKISKKGVKNKLSVSDSTTPKQALPVADLSCITVGSAVVGGRPQSIAWDPVGRYLAVTFKDSGAVAIFLTSINRSKLSLAPNCFLVGLGAEVPSFICFQERYQKKPDTVLTIGWSSGRVQFFPFL